MLPFNLCLNHVNFFCIKNLQTSTNFYLINLKLVRIKIFNKIINIVIILSFPYNINFKKVYFIRTVVTINVGKKLFFSSMLDHHVDVSRIYGTLTNFFVRLSLY
jgi:hypothetical protein